MTIARTVRAAVALAAVSTLAATLLGGPNGGDLAQQQPKYKIDKIPPAPVLSADEELKTFKVPKGFKVELVAAEPMVQEPIALSFDPDGRMYVVELRGYMPDIEGTGELNPVGRVSILEDTNNDGKADKSTVFLDKLIAPRAIGMARDGVLIAEPPNVYLCRDTNGDGVADEKQLVFTDYGSRNPNPEHMANGLVWMMDNWCYSANWPTRFRYPVPGTVKPTTAPSTQPFVRDGTISRGQWGITQDDTGRLYYNSNSTMLNGEMVPSNLIARNPFAQPTGFNANIASNKVFPSRVNPGVNRGYTSVLADDGKLATVTAASAPVIYRGELFPQEFHGNAFVPEPAGNLISRQVISESNVKLTAKSVQTDNVDFLTSTDERFRPVSLYSAPDGSIYVIDMYRGILQHKAYLSAYLKDQIQKRDLDKGIHYGRIWRIVPEGAKVATQPKLSKATPAELVKTLSHPNGWWRDTAQRLLVQKPDPAAVPLLRALVTAKDSNPLAKVHALWALEGMGKLSDEVMATAVKDADPRVRVAAIRVSEMPVRKSEAGDTLAAIIEIGKDKDPQVQMALLLMGSLNVPEAQANAASILVQNADNPLFRSAALSAATGRELDWIKTLMADPSFAKASKGRDEVLNDLAECVVRGRSPERIEALLALAADAKVGGKEVQESLVAGVADAMAPQGKGATPRKLRLLREPPALPKLLASTDKKLHDLAKKAESGMSWPNKPGDTTPPLKPLTEIEQTRFNSGKELYTNLCAACHQPSGLGQEGVAPPLVDSEWVLGTVERPARIILNGLEGPIKVGKRTFALEMPNLAVLNDNQIAEVLTYLRREWGHESNAVTPETIAKIRKEVGSRGEKQWTAEELLKIK